MFSIDAKNSAWLNQSNAVYTRTERRAQHCQSLLLDIEKTIDTYEEAVVKAQQDTEHRIEVNIGDLKQRIDEIMRVKATLEIEMGNVCQQRLRVSDYQQHLETEAKPIVDKCVLLRQNRHCIDLYGDSVDKTLTQELSMLQDIIQLTCRLQEQATEHTRRLKQLVLRLDADLKDKDASLQVDQGNADLKRESLLLTLDKRKLPIDTRKYSHEENTQATKSILRESNQQLVTCRHFRSMVEYLLKQTVEHLRGMKDLADEAFRRKIEEYQDAKTRLESQHYETLRSMCDLNNTISDLEKAIEDKRGFIMLAHSRLVNRASRPGVELVRDDVDARLEREIDQLKSCTAHLHRMLAEAKASVRNLAKAQQDLEVNITVKSNSLKLDQVDCCVLRLGLNYNVY